MTTPPGAFGFTDSNLAPWRPSAVVPGVWIKDLGATDGRRIELVRCDPGVRFPLHVHHGPEFVYVLEGEAIQRGRRLGSGCVGIAATGTEEDDFMSEIGCTFLLVYTE
jgi:anti-sigma factor ChrR (cupin superfamily)